MISRVRVLGSLALIAAALAFAHHDARACVIIAPSVVAPSLTPAPRNAHVWIQSLPLPLFGGATFTLVKSATGSTPTAIELRSWETSSVWELVPRSDLDALTRYEVWGAPRDKRAPVLVSVFRTGAGVDLTAPRAPRLEHAFARPSAMGCPPYVELAGAAGADDSGDVFHAAWLAEGSARLAYDGPPATVFAWPKPTPTEPRPSADVLHGFRAPSATRIGVRTVDVAGNLSAPIELEIVR